MIGNAPIQDYLQRLDRIGQSLLFAGPAGVGKRQFAYQLADRLLGAHSPDLHIYRPEGKSAMHAIDAMRELSTQVYLTPQVGQWKVFVIEHAERMPPASANALLKTFEEPAPHTLICLITDDIDAMLPTIRSRSRTLFFKPVPTEELQKAFNLSPDLARLARGSVAKAKYLAEKGNDPLREVLVHALLGHSYETQEIADVLDARREELFDHLRKELTPSVELPAAARERLEKQIEGTAALAYQQEVDGLFSDILYWFRDLHMLKSSGDTTHLYHSHHMTDLLARIDRPFSSLEQVSKAIDKARLAFQRHTKLSTCLEALFLQL